MLFNAQDKQASVVSIINLNNKIEAQRRAVADAIMSKIEKRKLSADINVAKKKRVHIDSRLYVIDFYGDVQASGVSVLRDEITLVLSVARLGKDSVVLRLESPGGLVHGYGLAAAQLARLKDAGIPLIICVDKVAASGGYMMACIADTIIAAPFAVLGSIGVVAQMPNFHKLLQHLKIDFDVYTAGEYKRTVTVFGENSHADKIKFESELTQTHLLFKDFVEQYRPQLDVAAIATGEHWYGEDALKLKLVDVLQTSDAYIMTQLETNEVLLVKTSKKPTLFEKMGLQAAQLTSQLLPAAVDGIVNQLHRIQQFKVQL